MHELYLQQNSVLSEEVSSGTPDMSNSNENSILSATSSPPKREQIANRTGTSNSVLSGPSSMNMTVKNVCSLVTFLFTALGSHSLLTLLEVSLAGKQINPSCSLERAADGRTRTSRCVMCIVNLCTHSRDVWMEGGCQETSPPFVIRCLV